jgi:hypothetical protein
MLECGSGARYTRIDSANGGEAFCCGAKIEGMKRQGRLGSIFGDPIIATATLDPLLHHPMTIKIRGKLSV